jgi:hypothetical protein
LLVCAYLPGGFTALDRAGRCHRRSLAWRVSGKEPVEDAIGPIRDVLAGWGCHRRGERDLTALACQVLLLSRSPWPEDLSVEVLTGWRSDPAMGQYFPGDLHGVHRAVAAPGLAEPPAAPRYGDGPAAIPGAPDAWTRWAGRWHPTSTLAPGTRRSYRVVLATMGRWRAEKHPEITEPSPWTRQTRAARVAAVDPMAAGDYFQSLDGRRGRAGDPLPPTTQSSYPPMARAFVRDRQGWEWIPRRFDPATALGAPRSLRARPGPDPRVIAGGIGAKPLGAGLNLEAGGLPRTDGRVHPVEMIRAITLTWLFSGQRSDEIARLRAGCVRWQHDAMPLSGDCDQVLARDAVGLLDVPVRKTGTAVTEPVDPLPGQAIKAWQAVRPGQPKMPDRKTGGQAEFLFAIRARPAARHYLNEKIIPLLCRKAAVPARDVRGKITSHRARTTIASPLCNAKEPMTPSERHAWPGHASPPATRHHAKIPPDTLTRACQDAGYFERNVRTIEVLLDPDAVTSGQAAAGEPRQYHDLGHGPCSCTFFQQCPHQMACARCDFCTPKDSSKAQLPEAWVNPQQMLASIPLTDDQCAAIDDGHAAAGKLPERLTDVPAPAGPTPRPLAIPATATRLPIGAITQPGPRP